MPCCSIFKCQPIKAVLCLLLALSLSAPAQTNYEAKFILYNTFTGAVTGGIGAAINKQKQQKWYKAFVRGFLTGAGGGLVEYAGKKTNILIAQKHELGFAWLSRAIFYTGNSVVENAAANRRFWSQWHFDVGFVRVEYDVEQGSVLPRFMPSMFGGYVFILAHGGRFDALTSLRSGALTFRAREISYSPNLVASTTTNGFLFVNSLRSGPVFYETYAHEMVHSFQFQEFSGVNYFFKPLTDKWKERSPAFAKISRYVYGDLNYEMMLLNYFVAQRGYKGQHYCHNLLENEAEFLTTGRSACGH